MFDLDRLAAFDRGLVSLAPLPPRSDAALEARRPPHVPELPAMRCTMTARLGVEPLCPFARTGVPV
jgi:hypothetical protein